MLNKISILMFVMLFAGCAGHVQVTLDEMGLTDVEYQAKAQAIKAIEHALGKGETLRKMCPTHLRSKVTPKVLYYNTHEAVAAACKTKIDPMIPLEDQTPNGCYIDNPNGDPVAIVVNTKRHRGPHFLNSVYKTLVHEYSHYYFDHGGLPDKCKSEVFAQFNSDKAINSLILYTPGF